MRERQRDERERERGSELLSIGSWQSTGANAYPYMSLTDALYI